MNGLMVIALFLWMIMGMAQFSGSERGSQQHSSTRKDKKKNQDKTNFNEAFNKVYDTHYWDSQDGSIPRSGGGSDPCSNIFNVLLDQHIIDLPDVETIVQIGYGDFQLHQHLLLEGKQYIGYDVAEAIFRQTTYNTKFKVEHSFDDIVEYGDLLLIKDVMQHWPNKDVHEFVQRIIPHFKYALITNDYPYNEWETYRKDIKAGGFNGIQQKQLPKYCIKYMCLNHKCSFFCHNQNWLSDV